MRLPSSSGSAPASAARAHTGESGGSTSRPSTPARPFARTRPGSARPPKSSVRPVTTMVLPAPVSPVTTVSPLPSSRVASSIEPRPRMRSSVSTGAAPAAAGRPAADVPGAGSAVVVRAGTPVLPLGGALPAHDVAQQHVAVGEQLVTRARVVAEVAEAAHRQPELGHQPVAERGLVH